MELKDSSLFIETLAAKSALEEVISPHQTWGQQEKICILDRKYGFQKMIQTAESLGNKVSDSVVKNLDKIDFDRKKWKKSGIHCNKITSRNDAMSKLLEIRKTILDTMIEHKKEIHDENDTVEINQLADVFDVRFWNVHELMATLGGDMEKVRESLGECFGKNLEDGESMLIVEDIHALHQGLNLVLVYRIVHIFPLSEMGFE